jgi:hypothetical protein
MLATVKAHTLKFGFDQLDIRENDVQGGAFARPSYTFDNLLDFVQDEATTETATPPVTLVTYQQAPSNRRCRELYSGAYIQNDWKVMPRSTLNAASGMT